MILGAAPEFFHRSADDVARDLLGQRIVSRVDGVRTGGRIIETEAYLGVDDPASHAFRGRRHAGNASIYGPPGSWYVYRSYGIHWCLNLVTGPSGAGAAVLLRAAAVDLGVALIRARRGSVPERRLADGPGKLAQALGIAGWLDGQPMADSLLVVEAGEAVPDSAVRRTPRVGITRAADWPLRFVMVGGRGTP